MRLSARNQIPATVTDINEGEAIANIALDANGIRLVASITVEAAHDLGLAVGTEVTAIIKASEVLLATNDCAGQDPGTGSQTGPIASGRSRVAGVPACPKVAVNPHRSLLARVGGGPGDDESARPEWSHGR